MPELEFTTKLEVKVYDVPFAEYLNIIIANLDITANDTTLELDFRYSSETSSISYLTILSMVYYGNKSEPLHTRPFNIHQMNITTIYDKINVNMFPVCLYLTPNEIIKFLNTLVTLCYTTNPANKKLIKQLNLIKEQYNYNPTRSETTKSTGAPQA